MEQLIINGALGLLTGLILFLLRTLWSSVREQREKLNALEILVAGQYLKRDEFRQFAEAIFKKLDRIEDRLERKEDRQ